LGFVLILLAMQHVIQAALEEVADVFIVQRIKDLAAFFARSHQSQLAQPTQVVGYGRLADPNDLRQRTDVELDFFQGRDDPNPARIAEGGEHFRQALRSAEV
jgi:hypothetical protein